MPVLVAQLPATDPTTAAIERGYYRYVAERLNGRILRYSQRLELIQAAERLRINRFRANLIIAMVQHQSVPQLSLVRDEPERESQPKIHPIMPILAGMVLAELFTVVSLCWLFHF